MSVSFRYLALSEQYLPLKGGHVVQLHELSRRIGEVRVLTSAMDGCPAHEAIDGVEILRIGLARWRCLRPESLFLYANLFLRGAMAILRQRPGTLVAARALPEGLVANALGRMFRVPRLVFAYGEEISPWTSDAPRPERRRWTAAVKGRLLWKVYHGADLVLACSHFTQGLLAAGGVDGAKLHVVYPGTDAGCYKPLPKDETLAERWGTQRRNVILTVGRLTGRKGQDMVLRALPAILEAVPNTLYLISGSGPFEPELRELAGQLNLSHHVRFLGEIPSPQLPWLYNLADVFVMPNRMTPVRRDLEGFGIVFLEASACEVPVIGGRSGGAPEAVADGETGLLVDGTSPRAISQAVIRLLQDRNLARRMGKAGRQRVLREFTWDRAAQRMSDLVQRVATRETGRHPSETNC